MAIKKMLAMEPPGLHATIRQHRISMCGCDPTVTILCATLEMGASQADLVEYMTSAEVSGDRENVVGYVGILIK